VRAALRDAPRGVSLDGVRLSDCLTEKAGAGDLQMVGGAWVRVASHLADRARARPEGADAVRLGYLVGAARHGAAHTEGVHAELLRRLEQESAPVGARSAAFRRGRRAGLRLG
jgi:hypothetical protein